MQDIPETSLSGNLGSLAREQNLSVCSEPLPDLFGCYNDEYNEEKKREVSAVKVIGEKRDWGKGAAPAGLESQRGR